VSEPAPPAADQSTGFALVPVEFSLKITAFLHAHQAILTSMDPASDAYPHALNVASDLLQAVLTVSKASSSTPIPDSVLPVLPATSVKSKSMEPVKESVKLDTSIKTVPASLENAQSDSRIMASEDVSFRQPTPTDAKCPPSDLTECASRTAELLSSPTATPEPAMPVQPTAEPASANSSVSNAPLVSLRSTADA